MYTVLALRRLALAAAVLVLAVVVFILWNSSRPNTTLQTVGIICVVMIVLLVLWDALSNPEKRAHPAEATPQTKTSTFAAKSASESPDDDDPDPYRDVSRARQRFKKADARLDSIDAGSDALVERAKRRASRQNIEDKER